MVAWLLEASEAPRHRPLLFRPRTSLAWRSGDLNPTPRLCPERCSFLASCRCAAVPSWQELEYLALTCGHSAGIFLAAMTTKGEHP